MLRYYYFFRIFLGFIWGTYAVYRYGVDLYNNIAYNIEYSTFIQSTAVEIGN
jgi:hypothetical protein